MCAFLETATTQDTIPTRDKTFVLEYIIYRHQRKYHEWAAHSVVCKNPEWFVLSIAKTGFQVDQNNQTKQNQWKPPSTKS